MTIMALANHRPDVLHERARATVLVATAATGIGTRSAQGTQASRALMASRWTTRALRTRNGHVLVRSVFGVDPHPTHLDLTRRLFADCDGVVRGDLWASFAALDLLAGIAAMEVPTTVMVGSRDGLTVPAKAQQIVATIPGARLVTLENRGHMLPLEDPDAVVEEIVTAAWSEGPAAVTR
jgi:pimeloyl-ACP methyl ester carboxylesterase